MMTNYDDLSFPPGRHYQLQKAVLMEFAPRFAADTECLYVGDSTGKGLFKNEEKLSNLGFSMPLPDNMPDIVLYSADNDWVYFFEAVTSAGPMTPKRIKEIEAMTAGVAAGKIYITAFPDSKTFTHFSDDLAWDTTVWIAAEPDHTIYYE